MERVVVDQTREEDRVHLLGVERSHLVEAAVLAKLRHRPLGELPGVGFRHHVGVEGARRVGDVDDAAERGAPDIVDVFRRADVAPQVARDGRSFVVGRTDFGSYLWALEAK